MGHNSGRYGTGATPLTVTFNSDATLARVQSVFQAATIVGTGDTPALGKRTLEITISDGDGGTSNAATACAAWQPTIK